MLPPAYILPTTPTPPPTVIVPDVLLVEVTVPWTSKVVSIIALPYILVPDCNFAIYCNYPFTT